MDPPGTISIFLSLTSGRSAALRRRIAWQAPLVAFFVIVLFALFGQQILAYLDITLPALQCAGGLLLLLVALVLLTGKADEPTQTKDVNWHWSRSGRHCSPDPAPSSQRWSSCSAGAVWGTVWRSPPGSSGCMWRCG